MNRKGRHRVLGCLGVVGLLVLLAGGLLAREVYLALNATPGSSINYRDRLAELSEQGQPEGKNGWPHLVEAAEASELTQLELGIDRPMIDDLPQLLNPGLWEPQTLSPDEARVLSERLFERLAQHGFDGAIDRFMSCPRAVRPLPDAAMHELDFPHLASLRRSCRSG